MLKPISCDVSSSPIIIIPPIAGPTLPAFSLRARSCRRIPLRILLIFSIIQLLSLIPDIIIVPAAVFKFRVSSSSYTCLGSRVIGEACLLLWRWRKRRSVAAAVVVLVISVVISAVAISSLTASVVVATAPSVVRIRVMMTTTGVGVAGTSR
jgi:hypothetical protein